MNVPDSLPDCGNLLSRIASLYTDGQTAAVRSVQRALLLTYWQIGQTIVEFDQHGQARASYGSKLMTQLSTDLSVKFGKGFSRSNLNTMRLLFIKYDDKTVLSDKLTWAHYTELVKIDHVPNRYSI